MLFLLEDDDEDDFEGDDDELLPDVPVFFEEDDDDELLPFFVVDRCVEPFTTLFPPEHPPMPSTITMAASSINRLDILLLRICLYVSLC